MMSLKPQYQSKFRQTVVPDEFKSIISQRPRKEKSQVLAKEAAQLIGVCNHEVQLFEEQAQNLITQNTSS